MRNRKVKYIDFVFENTEVYRVQTDDIAIMTFTRIYNNKCVNMFQDPSNGLVEIPTCNEAFICFKDEALKIKGGFDGKETLGERLQRLDMTEVDITTEDGEEFLYIPWSGKSDHTNEWATLFYSSMQHTDKEFLCFLCKQGGVTLGDIEKYE